MTWWEYVQRHTQGSTTQEQIASRAGVDQTAVSRWKREGSTPAAHTVIEIARALGRPPAEALVAAGLITPEEAAAQVTVVSVTEPTDDELVDLIARRLRDYREDVTGNAEHPAPTSAAVSTPARKRVTVVDGEVFGRGKGRTGEPRQRPQQGSRRQPPG